MKTTETTSEDTILGEVAARWFRGVLTGQQTEAPAATPPSPVHPINAAIRRAAGRPVDKGVQQ